MTVSAPNPAASSSSRPLLSVVVPAFDEEANLPVLYDRLAGVLDQAEIAWELIIVDDHSADRTFEIACNLSRRDRRVRTCRLARNCGSHVAILCGMTKTTGETAAIMAADLQDPPEVLLALVDRWRSGAQVVWAVRGQRLGISWHERFTSQLFHSLMSRLLRRPDLPAEGADFFLIDRTVVTALNQVGEANSNVYALVQWMGFRQDSLVYDKQPRLHGNSGWTLRKKIKLLIDSVTSFSYAPIRAMSWTGVCIALLGFLYAIWVIINWLIGNPSEGWSSLTIIVLVVGGIQMCMLGVLGEYIWRTLDEARRRPLYLIEADSEHFRAPYGTARQDSQPDTDRNPPHES